MQLLREPHLEVTNRKFEAELEGLLINNKSSMLGEGNPIISTRILDYRLKKTTEHTR